MKYNLKNKTITIPDNEIKNSMDKLGLSKEEAIQLWLEDNDYTVNEEQVELDKKAKKVKIQHEAAGNVEKKSQKHRNVKVSDTKKSLFDTILTNIDRNELVDRENITVLKENKLIQVKIGDETFKIDLIQQRKG